MMSNATSSMKLLRDYLLQKLNESDRDDLENRYFQDTELFLELIDVRHRLLRDYLDGRLGQDESKMLEWRCFANDEWRMELALVWLMRSPDSSRNLFIEKNKTSDETNLGFLSHISIGH